LAQIQNKTAVSKSFFIYKVLKGEKIPHSDHFSFYLLYEKYKAENKTLEFIKYKKLVLIQCNNILWRKNKLEAESGK
jgi:hypothetical protein